METAVKENLWYLSLVQLLPLVRRVLAPSFTSGVGCVGEHDQAASRLTDPDRARFKLDGDIVRPGAAS